MNNLYFFFLILALCLSCKSHRSVAIDSVSNIEFEEKGAQRKEETAVHAGSSFASFTADSLEISFRNLWPYGCLNAILDIPDFMANPDSMRVSRFSENPTDISMKIYGLKSSASSESTDSVNSKDSAAYIMTGKGESSSFSKSDSESVAIAHPPDSSKILIWCIVAGAVVFCIVLILKFIFRN